MEVEPTAPAVVRPSPCCRDDGGHEDCDFSACLYCSCDECHEGRLSGIRLPPGRIRAAEPSLVSREDVLRWRAKTAAGSLERLKARRDSWERYTRNGYRADGSKADLFDYSHAHVSSLTDAIARCEKILREALEEFPEALQPKKPDASRQPLLLLDLTYRPSVQFPRIVAPFEEVEE